MTDYNITDDRTFLCTVCRFIEGEMWSRKHCRLNNEGCLLLFVMLSLSGEVIGQHNNETVYWVFILCAFITARCTIVQSAALRLHVVRPSVCLSVCDVGGSGSHTLESHTLEILETNCTDI